MFVGAKKDTRDVGGEGAVFAGSKKCTHNSTDCLLCLRVLKKIPVMLVERVLCLRVQKNAPAMVLHIVILSVAKDLAGCTNILWFGYLEILHFVQNDSA